MRILICRVAWMPEYRSDDEEAIGDWPKKEYEPFERLNFLPVDGTYYGYVEIGGRNITLENLEGKAADESVTGVLVVFCSKEPEIREFLVTGWYVGATVYRKSIGRPGDDHERRVNITAREATLVPESERCFRMPRARTIRRAASAESGVPPSGTG